MWEGGSDLSRPAEEPQQGSWAGGWGGNPWAASVLCWSRLGTNCERLKHTYVFWTTGRQTGEVWGPLGPQGQTLPSPTSDNGRLASFSSHAPPPPRGPRRQFSVTGLCPALVLRQMSRVTLGQTPSLGGPATCLHREATAARSQPSTPPSLVPTKPEPGEPGLRDPTPPCSPSIRSSGQAGQCAEAGPLGPAATVTAQT